MVDSVSKHMQLVPGLRDGLENRGELVPGGLDVVFSERGDRKEITTRDREIVGPR